MNILTRLLKLEIRYKIQVPALYVFIHEGESLSIDQQIEIDKAETTSRLVKFVEVVPVETLFYQDPITRRWSKR